MKYVTYDFQYVGSNRSVERIVGYVEDGLTPESAMVKILSNPSMIDGRSNKAKFIKNGNGMAILVSNKYDSMILTNFRIA